MNIGIYGSGKIADRMTAAIVKHPYCQAKAVASRNLEHAQAFAEKWNIRKFGNSFESLLEDPKIDAIYLAVPHKFHAPYALEALKHHKAVLCEKPAVISVSQMEEIMKASKDYNTLFMEAMKTRFVPGYRKIKEFIQNGEIGDLTQINLQLCSDFGDLLLDETKYYNQKDQGGCLYDGGCYEVSYLTDLLSENNMRILKMNANVVNDVDNYVYAIMDFDGVTVVLENAIDRKKSKNAEIKGTKGTLFVENLHRPDKFTLVTKNSKETYDVSYQVNDMYSQLDDFYNSWLNMEINNSTMPQEDSLRQIQILTALRRSALANGRHKW